MKSLLKLSIPAIAVALCLTQSAIAQIDGYRFGVGLDYAGGQYRCDRNFFGLPIAPTPRIDQPPFFALYPPVYYSQDIVARPYGISPYAAPAGIIPTEMGGAVPIHQVNPYYVDPSVVPPILPQAPETKGAEEGRKTTWIKNPYFDSLAAPGAQIARN